MIKGEKVTLRPLLFNDWGKTITWRNNINLTHLVMSHPFPISDLLEKSWFESILNDKSNKNIYFGIEENQSEKLIGIVSLSNINWINGVCYFSILLGDENSRGKRYGTETMKLIIKYAFEILNLRKIILEVVTENRAIDLYKKMGFLQEGLMKKHHYYNNMYYDVYILSLFK